MFHQTTARNASLWAIIWTGHSERLTDRPVVFGDIVVCADVCSAVVATKFAKRAEKVLMLCYQPFGHKLLTFCAADTNIFTLVDVIIIASKFTNPLTALVTLGALNPELFYITSYLLISENTVCLLANWTSVVLLVCLGDARQAEVMSTVCLMRVP